MASSLTACQFADRSDDGSEKPSVALMTTEKAKTVDVEDDGDPRIDHSRLPTHSGYLYIKIPRSEGSSSTLIKHDTQGHIMWAATITPAIIDTYYDDDSKVPQAPADSLLYSRLIGYAVVSPDGRYASFILRPTDVAGPYEQDDDTYDHDDDDTTTYTVADQRTYVVVIETETGKTVRTEELKGLILGQALTNDTLAVETSQSYYPGGDGHGAISAFSLNRPTAQATTIPTEQWLVGATSDSLLLTPSNMSERELIRAEPLTRMSTRGDVVETVSGVTDVYLGGWIERVTDGTSGTDSASPKEVVNLSTGVATDVTGLAVREVTFPTAAGLLVSQETSTGEGRNKTTTSTPRFWLSAADDGHPHTENLEQFTNK
ncbi:hypothetical protein [Actinomyces viscosus]|uniref:hypothetical protein n=1 Tax=Actinomyces viscosus TaxID=1656 RepID=UPI0028ED916D|nr:hypothetical protein [Actinomyces viscosus]